MQRKKKTKNRTQITRIGLIFADETKKYQRRGRRDAEEFLAKFAKGALFILID